MFQMWQNWAQKDGLQRTIAIRFLQQPKKKKKFIRRTKTPTKISRAKTEKKISFFRIKERQVQIKIRILQKKKKKRIEITSTPKKRLEKSSTKTICRKRSVTKVELCQLIPFNRQIP